MKPGDLITLKSEHSELPVPKYYLIVDQVQYRNDWELVEYPCFLLLDKHGAISLIPLHSTSIFAYELFSEAA